MARRALQAAAGVGVGMAVRLVLPGHHPVSLLLTAALSLAGALAAGTLADALLPSDTRPRGGFVASALGAVGMLLIHGVAVTWARL